MDFWKAGFAHGLAVAREALRYGLDLEDVLDIRPGQNIRASVLGLCALRGEEVVAEAWADLTLGMRAGVKYVYNMEPEDVLVLGSYEDMGREAAE